MFPHPDPHAWAFRTDSHDHPHEPTDLDADDNALEVKHIAEIVRAFVDYGPRNLATNDKRRRDLSVLSQRQRALVPSLARKINDVEVRIRANAAFLRELVEGYETEETWKGSPEPVPERDADKVRSTLRQFARDWSAEGKPERDASYGLILNELETRFKDVSIEKRGEIRVLVPGAGLGRLAYEIVSRGFTCEGNEFSIFMLIASEFILNRTQRVNQVQLYPWVHSFSNTPSIENHVNGVMIPDVHPAVGIPPTADFSMAAGDFVEVYSEDSQKDRFDVIVTCFFMDTAKNVVEYVDVILNLLKKGGLWINFGPLLWHWEGNHHEPSIELSLDEFKDMIQRAGFTFESQQMAETTYAGAPHTMLRSVYNCFYFAAIKQ